MDFTVPSDHRVKLKESEKNDKFLGLARELKKLWNMKLAVILVVIGALGKDTKGLVQGQKDLKIRGRVETIQTAALLRLAKIMRRVQETWGTCCHSNSSEKHRLTLALETWEDLLSLKLLWKTISWRWCEKL